MVNLSNTTNLAKQANMHDTCIKNSSLPLSGVPGHSSVQDLFVSVTAGTYDSPSNEFEGICSNGFESMCNTIQALIKFAVVGFCISNCYRLYIYIYIYLRDGITSIP